MGRQWLHAKREVANLKKGQVVGKLVKEIMVAAKTGGPDVEGNARLFAAVEKARKASVTRDVIERAVKKGAGIGDEKLTLEHLVFEGYAPHKVPVIVEVLTDNINRTAPEMRVLFETAAIEAGANDFSILAEGENDDIPSGALGVKFLTERTATAAVSKWLSQNGWTVVTSELGYVPKQFPDLTDEQRAEAGEFLQALEDHDDAHRVWAAIK
jgi:transcriptional/translational regulatory protein YebC/TACO1